MNFLTRRRQNFACSKHFSLHSGYVRGAAFEGSSNFRVQLLGRGVSIPLSQSRTSVYHFYDSAFSQLRVGAKISLNVMKFLISIWDTNDGSHLMKEFDNMSHAFGLSNSVAIARKTVVI